MTNESITEIVYFYLILTLKGIYYCPIGIVKGLTDKGQF